LDARDDGRRARIDGLEHLPHRVGVGDVLVDGQANGRTHPLHVGAGREAGTFTGEHDGARTPDVDEGLR